MFDTTEKAFDDVPGPIQHAAIATPDFPVRTQRDYGLCMRTADTLHKGVRIVAFVGNDRADAQMLNQFIRARNIGNLPFGGHQPQRAASVIDGQVQPGGQSTSRARAVRFFSSAGRVLVRAHDGRIDQHMPDPGFVSYCVYHAFPRTLATPPGKRMYTLCHRPNAFGNRSGRSRGQPRQTSNCRSPFVLDRLLCPARQIRFVPLLHRSLTLESSWPTRAKDKM